LLFLLPGSITISDLLDYELIKTYQLTVRATDIDTGSFAEAAVQIDLLVMLNLKTSPNDNQGVLIF
jgi:hypothetical protein